MWVKVDDGFPEHQKVVEAGRHLGKRGGRGRVIAIWQVAMCYCNRNLTDGFIDEPTVRTWTLYDQKPFDVALVMALPLSDGRPGLMVRVDGGFRMHDYDDYQPSATEVRAKRKKDRDRKRAERLARLGVQPPVHADTSRTSDGNPQYPTRPGPTHQEDHRGSRREISTPVENLRVLKALVWREVHALYRDASVPFDLPEITERLKCVAARAGLVYAVDEFHRQIERAMTRVPHQTSRSAA